MPFFYRPPSWVKWERKREGDRTAGGAGHHEMFDSKKRDVRTGADLGPAQAPHWAEFSMGDCYQASLTIPN